MSTKKCVKCKTTTSAVWHRGPLCKRCYAKRWRTANKESVACSNQKWRDANRERELARHKSPKARFNNASRYADRRGKTWDIAFEIYAKLISRPCHYCNNELGSMAGYGVGLDRIDNSVGYLTGNVLPCCKICNSIRNDFLTVEETKVAVSAVIAFRKQRAAGLS